MTRTKKVFINTAKSGILSEDNFNCYYELLKGYDDWSKKEFVGERGVCRFCGESDSKKFKRGNAHTFPEFTGNKWLFSNDECKNCNELFSLYENELSQHSLLERAFLGMKTKSNKPTAFKNNLFDRIHHDENGILFKLDSQKAGKINSEKDGNVNFNMNFINGKHVANISIPQPKIIPLYLYKSLCKIAFSIMPDSELVDDRFDLFKKLLLDTDYCPSKEDVKPYFFVYYNHLTMVKRDPLLMLYKKHNNYKKKTIPTYSFLFCFGANIYQIYLPFCQCDEWIDKGNRIDLLIIPELLKINGNDYKFSMINGTVGERIRMETKQIDKRIKGTK